MLSNFRVAKGCMEALVPVSFMINRRHKMADACVCTWYFTSRVQCSLTRSYQYEVETVAGMDLAITGFASGTYLPDR